MVRALNGDPAHPRYSGPAAAAQAHRRSRRLLAALDPDKDVDGLTVTNAGRLASGLLSPVPCTLDGLHGDAARDPRPAGRQAGAGGGRSILVGKPLAQLLLAADCTVTIAHSKTVDLPAALPRGRDPLRRDRRPPADDPGRLDPAWRDSDRCRCQPRALPRPGCRAAAGKTKVVSATSTSRPSARPRAGSRRCLAAWD